MTSARLYIQPQTQPAPLHSSPGAYTAMQLCATAMRAQRGTWPSKPGMRTGPGIYTPGRAHSDMMQCPSEPVRIGVVYETGTSSTFCVTLSERVLGAREKHSAGWAAHRLHLPACCHGRRSCLSSLRQLPHTSPTKSKRTELRQTLYHQLDMSKSTVQLQLRVVRSYHSAMSVFP